MTIRFDNAQIILKKQPHQIHKQPGAITLANQCIIIAEPPGTKRIFRDELLNINVPYHTMIKSHTTLLRLYAQCF